jgi:hypothetical protein
MPVNLDRGTCYDCGSLMKQRALELSCEMCGARRKVDPDWRDEILIEQEMDRDREDEKWRDRRFGLDR